MNRLRVEHSSRWSGNARSLAAAAAFSGAALCAPAAVIDITADRTLTDSDQALISASDGFAIASGATLTFSVSSALTLGTSQPISGSGNVSVTGSGALHVKGANPDFTGKITVNTAALHVYHRNSTGPDNGSGASGTELVGSASIHLHNCNLFESLAFPDSRSAYVWADEGDCYLCCNPSGKCSPAAAAGATFHTQSTWVPWCDQYPIGGGTVDYNSAYMGCFVGGIYNHTATTVLLSKKANQGSSVIDYHGWCGQGIYPTVKFGAVDVGNGYRILCTCNSATWCNNVIDLNGKNQTAVPELTCPYLGNGKAATLGSIMKSASPAYLRALASGQPYNAVAFTEHAGFRWAGETDLELTGVSTSDNELWVEKAKLTIGTGASWAKASAVRAIGTGTLCLSHAGCVGAATQVYLTENGKVEIPEGVTVMVDALFLDGEMQPVGTYGGFGSGAAHELPERFAGTGVLVSSRELAIAADTTWSVADYATIRTSYGRVSISSGVTLTIHVPAGETLEIDDGFTIGGQGAVRKSGTGALHLKGAHDFTGMMTVDGGSVHVYDPLALGPASSQKTVLNGGASVRLHAVTINEEFDFQGGRLWGEKGTSILTRNPSFNSSASGFFSAANGATLDLRPTLMPSGYIGPEGQGTVIFNSSYLHPWGGWWHNSAATVVFAKGCYNGNCTYRIFHGQVLPKCVFAAKDVANTLNLVVGHEPGWNNAELDLAGNDQTAVPLFDGYAGRNAADCPVVKSATPATLRALSSSLPSNGVVFTEHAGFTWAGSGELELCEPSTSDGPLAVESGTLTMGPNGSWTNAATVAARGTGTLRVRNGAAFGPGVTLRIDDQGKVCADGVRLRVKALYVDGKEMLKGRYGATGSGAGICDDVHFSGTGYVRVSGDGTIVILR